MPQGTLNKIIAQHNEIVGTDYNRPIKQLLVKVTVAIFLCILGILSTALGYLTNVNTLLAASMLTLAALFVKKFILGSAYRFMLTF